jgi:hypothetical protein
MRVTSFSSPYFQKVLPNASPAQTFQQPQGNDQLDLRFGVKRSVGDPPLPGETNDPAVEEAALREDLPAPLVDREDQGETQQ